MEPPTLRQLDQLLAAATCYQHKDRIRNDVGNLLRQVNSLFPRTGPLIHNTGQVSTLIHLSGTIPIHYQGTQYNIPVEIWITEPYPTGPPRCYVRPTPGDAR